MLAFNQIVTASFYCLVLISFSQTYQPRVAKVGCTRTHTQTHRHNTPAHTHTRHTHTHCAHTGGVCVSSFWLDTAAFCSFACRRTLLNLLLFFLLLLLLGIYVCGAHVWVCVLVCVSVWAHLMLASRPTIFAYGSFTQPQPGGLFVCPDTRTHTHT